MLLSTKIAKKKAESTEVDVDALIEDEESSEFKQKFNAMVEAKKKEDKKTMAKKKDEKMEEGKGDGNLANNAKPYDKVTRGDVIAGRLGKDEMGGKKKKAGGKKTESVKTPKRVVA